ncbi:MAG: hypothetical protein AAF252_03450 [Pseudomonadota bacterium]
MFRRRSSQRTVAGCYAPPSKPTVFGAAVVASLVTLPIAFVVLCIEALWR